jgi:hypothetical protein
VKFLRPLVAVSYSGSRQRERSASGAEGALASRPWVGREFDEYYLVYGKIVNSIILV